MGDSRAVQDQFCADFIKGKEDQMLNLVDEFDAINGKVLELQPYEDADDVARKIKGVAAGMFQASSNDGRILAFLIFAYGISALCSGKYWFDASMVIQPVTECIPTFLVKEVRRLYERPTTLQQLAREVARVGCAIRALWKH